MTQAVVDLSAKALNRYLVHELAPVLGPQFQRYGRRALVRMRGSVVQYLVLSASRTRVLVVSPGLFVCGADPNFPVLGGALSHRFVRKNNWNFVDPKLDEGLTNRIVTMLQADCGPLSFFSGMTDDLIGKEIKYFIHRGNFWSYHLHMAFFNITRGDRAAGDDLTRAVGAFKALPLPDPPRDHDRALLRRFATLEARLDQPDCVALCRADAEEHARRLRLPPIRWPSEWPTVTLPRRSS